MAPPFAAGRHRGNSQMQKNGPVFNRLCGAWATQSSPQGASRELVWRAEVGNWCQTRSKTRSSPQKRPASPQKTSFPTPPTATTHVTKFDYKTNQVTTFSLPKSDLRTTPEHQNLPSATQDPPETLQGNLACFGSSHAPSQALPGIPR